MISDILRVNLKDSPQVKIIFVLGGFLSQLIFWLALKKCCLTAPNKCLNVSQFFQILNQSPKETLEHLSILTNSHALTRAAKTGWWSMNCLDWIKWKIRQPIEESGDRLICALHALIFITIGFLSKRALGYNFSFLGLASSLKKYFTTV